MATLFLTLAPGVSLVNADSRSDVLRDLANASGFSSHRLTVADGLPQETALSSTQIRDGYQWFGAFGGLVRFDGLRCANSTVENTPALRSNRILPLDDEIWSIPVRAAGDIWTAGCTLYRFHGGVYREVVLPVLEEMHSCCVHADLSGGLWAGTDRGLDASEGNTFVRWALGGEDRDGDPKRIGNLITDASKRLRGVAHGTVGNLERGVFHRAATIPGEWVTTVGASRDGGVQSERAATHRIHAAPFYDEAAWFRVFCVIGALAAAVGVHRVCTKWLTQHAAELRAEISERERAEKARRRLEAALAESTKFEAIGRLACGVAHEFNNVLTAVMGRSELLKANLEREPDSHTARRVMHVDEILRSSERAARLTEQLLAFSRQQLLRPDAVRVGEAIQKLEPMLQDLLPSGILLEVQCSEGTPPVFIDPGQFDQVITNLVLDARDAMPEGGVITITTAFNTDNAKPTEDRVEIAVRVTGARIEDAVMPHILEPFSTTKSLGRGAGLGLASVHGIVTQSGGEVSVQSGTGRGVLFRVLLPPASDGTVSHSDPAGGDEKSLAGRASAPVVLVCDDDTSLTPVFENSLVAAGFTTYVSTSVRDAQRLAESLSRIDLLITDMLMPDGDGEQVDRAVHARHPTCKTLFVSGFAGAERHRRQRADPPPHFLPKPFDTHELLNAAEAVLNA